MNRTDFKSTFDKIDYDIQMKSYDKHNNDIATINDNLGDYYGYSDLINAEEYQLKDERNMYRELLKEQCGKIDKAIECIKNTQFMGFRNGKCIISEFLTELLEILGEDNNES